MLSDDIINALKNISSVYKENSKNIIIRCPYCGDSSNERSAHLYIGKEPPYPFHCFRAECEVSGTLLKLIKDLELTKYIDSKTLQVLYKNSFSSRKINFNINTFKVNFTRNKYPELEELKLNYIRNRLVIDDIPDWLDRFIVLNYDTLPNYDKNYIQFLNDNYVGFLTYNKHKIINRLFTNNRNLLRYVNISINKDKIDYFITYPNSNMKFTDNNGAVIIGEGVFDVVNGYYHLKQHGILNTNNVILASSGGKYYVSTYLYILKKYLKYNWTYYILLDTDINVYKIKKQFRYYNNYLTNIKFLKNKLSKDFGDKIAEPMFI